LLAAGLGVPLPEDIPLITAGWIVHKNDSSLILMMFVGLAGVLVGDSLMFHMGRKYGTHILEHRWLSRAVRPWMLQRTRQLYCDHGAKILFAARFMPGIRSAMFLSAGTFGVRYWKFFLIDGLAALISVPLWVWAGWKFSAHIENILGGARTATITIVCLLCIALVTWGIWEYKRLKKQAAKAEHMALQESEASACAEKLTRGSGVVERPSETSVVG
jgi:membrane protein DedA with SNARE-associated domain